MNGTAGLLQKSAGFLWRNPILVLPFLVARVVDFVSYWVCGLAKGPAMKSVAPQSVLGGFSGKISGWVVVVAAIFTFLPLLVEVALLVWAMAVTGRWAHSLRESDGPVDRSWKVSVGDVARVGVITLGIGAITAFVGVYFTLRGGVPARLSYVVAWCFLILAGWFILPFWLELLAKVQGVRVRDSSRVPPFVATALSFAAFAACIYAGGDVQHSLEVANRIHGAVAPFFINLAAALVSAIPLAFCFVALSRYVADRPGWQQE